MSLYQHTIAQPLIGSIGHAVRSGLTKQQPKQQSGDEKPSTASHFGHFDFEHGGFPKPPTFETKEEERDFLKGRLAAAFRIFGQHGYEESVAGHITVRDPVETEKLTLWVNPFGVAFSSMRKSDLIRVDREGNVLEGGPVRLVNRAAVVIHFAVHAARPDIVCAAHTHSIYGRTFSSLRIPLLTTTQDACAFYNDCALMDHFGGIVLEGEEGEDIAQALGDKTAVILSNHGLLTCSPSVEATVHWFITLEKLCHTQLTAMAAVGGDMSRLPIIGDEQAKTTYQSIGLPKSGWFASKFLFDQIAKATNEDYLA